MNKLSISLFCLYFENLLKRVNETETISVGKLSGVDHF